MKIQLGENEYRIVDGDNEGDLTAYGEVASLLADDGTVTHVAFTEASDLVPDVYCCQKMTDVETEDVDFGGDEEEAEEEEEEAEEVDAD